MSAEESPQPRTGATDAPRIYSPRMQPLMQSILATLADIDFDYERERERIAPQNGSDVNLRIKVLEKLKDRHRARREPYIQQLGVLQDRIRVGCTQATSGGDRARGAVGPSDQ
jgi:hypothetical protein